MSLAPAARRIVTALDREVPVANVQTMQTIVEQSTARTTFAMLLLAVAGGMALVLSAVGIYGVISYTVTSGGRDRRADGVRRAGRTGRPDGRRAIPARGRRGHRHRPAGAVATTRVMQSLLFDVSPTDPVTLGGVTVVLVMLGALAAYAPARRATKVDPVEVLRRE